MSVVRTPDPNRPEFGEKVVLSRDGRQMWRTIQREWAGDDPVRWKRLCILHLRVYCRWTNEMIGKAFGHPRGHISRIVASTKEELRAHFRLERSQKERPKPRDPDTNPDRPRESKTGEHPRYGSSSSCAGPVRCVTDWR